MMIADVAFTGIPFVTEKMNIPVLGIGIFPLMETSKDLAPAGLAMTPSTSFFGKKKQDILRFVADKVLFRKANKYMAKLFGQYGIKVEGNVFHVVARKSTLLLQSGSPGSFCRD